MKFETITESCQSCGAPLTFSPESGQLACQFCGSEEKITHQPDQSLKEDLYARVAELGGERDQEHSRELACHKCGAGYSAPPYTFALQCPYCGTPAVMQEMLQQITPRSLIPFRYSDQEAQQLFSEWLGSLWFAPNKLKRATLRENLKGYYLPHWIYDSDTVTQYQGERGDAYYVDVTKTGIEDGKERQVTVRESRRRWYPVSGRVSVRFDGLTVGASREFPATLIEKL